METWITAATAGIGAHFLYFVVAIGGIMLFVAIYTAITPYREITMIRHGNTAAAISLGGALVGFTFPLAQAVAQSGSLADMLIWSTVGLVAQLAAEFPGSGHVRDAGLAATPDPDVWAHAATSGFVIVSKDTDFQQRALLYGHPPKVIWLRLGNCTTAAVASLLRARLADIQAFEADPVASFLALS